MYEYSCMWIVQESKVKARKTIYWEVYKRYTLRAPPHNSDGLPRAHPPPYYDSRPRGFPPTHLFVQFTGQSHFLLNVIKSLHAEVGWTIRFQTHYRGNMSLLIINGGPLPGINCICHSLFKIWIKYWLLPIA